MAIESILAIMFMLHIQVPCDQRTAVTQAAQGSAPVLHLHLPPGSSSGADAAASMTNNTSVGHGSSKPVTAPKDVSNAASRGLSVLYLEYGRCVHEAGVRACLGKTSNIPITLMMMQAASRPSVNISIVGPSFVFNVIPTDLKDNIGIVHHCNSRTMHAWNQLDASVNCSSCIND